MEIYNSKFKYIHLSSLCSNWVGNCAHRLPIKWPNCHWNKRPFKWICLDGRIPMSKVFTYHTILWLTIPNHQFCFLIESFICNWYTAIQWCTAIHCHSNENLLHSDPTLRLLCSCLAITHMPEKHIGWLGFLGRIHYTGLGFPLQLFWCLLILTCAAAWTHWSTKCPFQFLPCPYKLNLAYLIPYLLGQQLLW